VNPLDRKNAQTTPAVGTVVAGKYRIERMLAEGGMGVVVAATHLHLARCVAVKFLRRDLEGLHAEWDAFARFLLEAKTVAHLRSEHVAHVLDAGVTEDGTAYTVMEYLEGPSLARLLEEQGAIEIATAVEYAIQVCEGLAEAHSLGIVHRDVKPDNLILVERSPGWRAIKIVDFGISKVALPDVPKVVTGVIIGSPCYMSPEQLRSTAGVDHRSDIWSLGATLYELLCGRAAFDASQTLPELVAAILEKPSPSLRNVRPEVPDELSDIVTRCLKKDREARFQSTGELATALLAFTEPRARVPAERAAAMRPFDMSSSMSESVPEVSVRAHDSAVQSGPPKAGDKAPTGPSLAPVTVAAPEISETPASRTPRGDRSQTEKNMEAADRVARHGARRWLRAAGLCAGAAALLFTVFFEATRGAGKEIRANGATTPVAGDSALTRPDPSAPTVTLSPLESSQHDSVQVAAPASSKKVPLDTASAHGSPPVTVGRNRPSAIPPRSTKHGSDPAAPPTAPMQPTTPSVAPNGGQVDPMGGKMPLRPIETRDPYGSR
jgi:serine/threonine-protein kinase